MHMVDAYGRMLSRSIAGRYRSTAKAAWTPVNSGNTTAKFA